jgi:tricorn protease
MSRIFASLPIFLLIYITTSISSRATELTLAPGQGYYRFPSIHDSMIVFSAEGDLWTVSISGGTAQRLTTNTREEVRPAISPDGRIVAFSGQYEGPTEVYVIPTTGGLPKRLTYHGGESAVVGWTPDGEILYATSNLSTLPNAQLIKINPYTLDYGKLPLNQAADGVYTDSGDTFIFTRLPFQGSSTRDYKGGAVQNIWKYVNGAEEAVPLTSNYPGISKTPMWYNRRIYFAGDRDGTMNIWSMNIDGGDLQQHTFHVGWDIKSPSQSNGKIVYQLGADLHLYDIQTDADKKLDITLTSDFEQMRDTWVENPIDYLTAAHLSPDGDRMVMTARGQIFVTPAKKGRLVTVTSNNNIRYRYARFIPDGKSILAISDSTGEMEFWKLPANGIGQPEQISYNAESFRFDGIPSPDGKYIAYSDINQKLWIYDIKQQQETLVDSSEYEIFDDFTWSPDSRWLAYIKNSPNYLGDLLVYSVADKNRIVLASNHFKNSSPTWSADGKWLYFISSRQFTTAPESPYSREQPFPYLENTSQIYGISLLAEYRSPFEPENELTASQKAGKKPERNTEKRKTVQEPATAGITIEPEGIQHRIIEVPVPPGDYSSLIAAENQLLWLASGPDTSAMILQSLEISNRNPEVATLIMGVVDFDMSYDRKKAMVQKGGSFFIFDITPSPPDLENNNVDLSGWTFPLNPRSEWRQMFIDAWRLERDLFYSPNMNGIDWKGVLNKYLPLMDRVTSRSELNDLLSDMVSNLKTLHVFVMGGAFRKGLEDINNGSLGAVLAKDSTAGGFRIEHIYRPDPQEPQDLSPLDRPDLHISEGDIIMMVNGIKSDTLSNLDNVLRDQAGKQVLINIKSHENNNRRDIIIKPLTIEQSAKLRYRDWEYSRRQIVDRESNEDIGYVHLSNMLNVGYAQWARQYYPVYNRKGLIIDVRHNIGGNIDSWILTSLIRKPWAYMIGRAGKPYWNMQSAFRGHMVVLCDEFTASDGEYFADGFRSLGLGKIIGVRTWGGGIGFSFDSFLVDMGIATVPEVAAYSPQGKWLIEGYGVEPDIIVDNLPHATYEGKDAQLEAAIDYLKEQIRLHPITTPPPPPYPASAIPSGK